ncbi:MAG: 30S ribosomal protein S8 [Acidobacteriota bacterium]|jgi:small subunit ribosomal protein S8
MSMTDPIADLLTRIRNGLRAKKSFVELPSSSLKVEVAKILKEEGYILDLKVTEDGKQGILRLDLKYSSDGRPVIEGLRRESSPGRRVYVGRDDIRPVLGGLGTGILTTSRGVLTDKQARREGVGGELLCTVW